MKSTPIKRRPDSPIAEIGTLESVSAHLRAFYKDRIGMFIPGGRVYGNFRIAGIGVPAKDGWYMGAGGEAMVQRTTSKPDAVRILLERIYDGSEHHES